jgi:hypothetical protein
MRPIRCVPTVTPTNLPVRQIRRTRTRDNQKWKRRPDSHDDAVLLLTGFEVHICIPRSVDSLSLRTDSMLDHKNRLLVAVLNYTYFFSPALFLIGVVFQATQRLKAS